MTNDELITKFNDAMDSEEKFVETCTAIEREWLTRLAPDHAIDQETFKSSVAEFIRISDEELLADKEYIEMERLEILEEAKNSDKYAISDEIERALKELHDHLRERWNESVWEPEKRLEEEDPGRYAADLYISNRWNTDWRHLEWPNGVGEDRPN